MKFCVNTGAANGFPAKYCVNAVRIISLLRRDDKKGKNLISNQLTSNLCPIVNKYLTPIISN
jgi:hypothetical protein